MLLLLLLLLLLFLKNWGNKGLKILPEKVSWHFSTLPLAPSLQTFFHCFYNSLCIFVSFCLLTYVGGLLD